MSGRENRRWRRRGGSRSLHSDVSRDERDNHGSHWSGDQYRYRYNATNASNSQFSNFHTFPYQIPNPWQFQFFDHQSWDQRSAPSWPGQSFSNQNQWQLNQNYNNKSLNQKYQNSHNHLSGAQHSRVDQLVEQEGQSQKKAKPDETNKSPLPGSEEARKKAVAQATDKLKRCLLSFQDQKPGVLEDLLSKKEDKKREEAKSSMAVMDGSRFVPELELTPKDWRDIGIVNTASAAQSNSATDDAPCETSDVIIVGETSCSVIDTVELDDSKDSSAESDMEELHDRSDSDLYENNASHSLTECAVPQVDVSNEESEVCDSSGKEDKQVPSLSPLPLPPVDTSQESPATHPPRRPRYTSETSHSNVEKPLSGPKKLRTRSASLNVSEIRSEFPGKKVKHFKDNVIRQLLTMSKSNLKDLVNNPRSRKLEFAMKHLVKEHRMLLSRQLRLLAQSRIREQQEPGSILEQEESLLDPDLAINLSTLPMEVIEQLENILQMDLVDCVEQEQASGAGEGVDQGLEELLALQEALCSDGTDQDGVDSGSRPDTEMTEVVKVDEKFIVKKEILSKENTSVNREDEVVQQQQHGEPENLICQLSQSTLNDELLMDYESQPPVLEANLPLEVPDDSRPVLHPNPPQMFKEHISAPLSEQIGRGREESPSKSGRASRTSKQVEQKKDVGVQVAQDIGSVDKSTMTKEPWNSSGSSKVNSNSVEQPVLESGPPQEVIWSQILGIHKEIERLVALQSQLFNKLRCNYIPNDSEEENNSQPLQSVTQQVPFRNECSSNLCVDSNLTIAENRWRETVADKLNLTDTSVVEAVLNTFGLPETESPELNKESNLYVETSNEIPPSTPKTKRMRSSISSKEVDNLLQMTCLGREGRRRTLSSQDRNGKTSPLVDTNCLNTINCRNKSALAGITPLTGGLSLDASRGRNRKTSPVESGVKQEENGEQSPASRSGRNKASTSPPVRRSPVNRGRNRKQARNHDKKKASTKKLSAARNSSREEDSPITGDEEGSPSRSDSVPSPEEGIPGGGESKQTPPSCIVVKEEVSGGRNQSPPRSDSVENSTVPVVEENYVFRDGNRKARSNSREKTAFSPLVKESRASSDRNRKQSPAGRNDDEKAKIKSPRRSSSREKTSMPPPLEDNSISSGTSRKQSPPSREKVSILPTLEENPVSRDKNRKPSPTGSNSRDKAEEGSPVSRETRKSSRSKPSPSWVDIEVPSHQFDIVEEACRSSRSKRSSSLKQAAVSDQEDKKSEVESRSVRSSSRRVKKVEAVDEKNDALNPPHLENERDVTDVPRLDSKDDVDESAVSSKSRKIANAKNKKRLGETEMELAHIDEAAVPADPAVPADTLDILCQPAVGNKDMAESCTTRGQAKQSSVRNSDKKGNEDQAHTNSESDVAFSRISRQKRKIILESELQSDTSETYRLQQDSDTSMSSDMNLNCKRRRVGSNTEEEPSKGVATDEVKIRDCYVLLKPLDITKSQISPSKISGLNCDTEFTNKMPVLKEEINTIEDSQNYSGMEEDLPIKTILEMLKAEKESSPPHSDPTHEIESQLDLLEQMSSRLDEHPDCKRDNEDSVSTLVSDSLSEISEGDHKFRSSNIAEDSYKDLECIIIDEGNTSKSHKHLSRKHRRDKRTDTSEQIVFDSHCGAILDIKTIGRHMLAACEDGNVYCYSAKTGKFKRKYEGHTAAVVSLFVLECTNNEIQDEDADTSPHLIFTGSLDHQLRCFAFQTAALVQDPVTVGSPIQCMDQNWETIFLGTKTGEVARFFIKSMKLAEDNLKCSEDPIFALKATREGPRNVLILATRNERISIRDATSGLLMRTVGIPNTVFSLVLDTSLIYCGTKNGKIEVLSFTTGEQVCKFQAGNGVVCMKIYNKLLFAGCYDGKIYIYSIADKTLITSIPGGKMMLCLDILKNRIIAGSKYKLEASFFPPEVRNYLREAKHRPEIAP